MSGSEAGQAFSRNLRSFRVGFGKAAFCCRRLADEQRGPTARGSAEPSGAGRSIESCSRSQRQLRESAEAQERFVVGCVRAVCLLPPATASG